MIYYTFREVFSQIYPVGTSNLDIAQKDVFPTIYTIIDEITDGQAYEMCLGTNNPRYSQELIWRLLSVNEERYCLRSEEEITLNIAKNKMANILMHIERTISNFAPLIKFQEDNINHLNDQLVQITKTKFNDTPQNAGDFSSDNHTTTYTESSTDVIMDLSAKLEVAKRFVDDIYQRWMNEIMKGWWF